MSLKEGHSDGTAFSMSFLSIISEGKLLTVNMGCIPNYQLPIQKSSALLFAKGLLKMWLTLTVHIRPKHMASINDTLLNRKKEVGARCNGPGHRYQPPCEVLLAEKNGQRQKSSRTEI